MRPAVAIACSLLACAEASQGPALCGPPDLVCPDEAPYSGLRCEGSLECDYPHPDFPSDPMGSRFTCTGGVWDEEVLCPGCPPRRFEICRDPPNDPIPGARVRVELAEEPIVWGPQGAPMIAHTVTIEGLEEARRCVEIRTRTSIDALTGPGEHALTQHCGRSQTIFGLLPALPCEPRDHLIVLEVEVLGAGSDRVSLTYDGTRCPPLPGS